MLYRSPDLLYDYAAGFSGKTGAVTYRAGNLEFTADYSSSSDRKGYAARSGQIDRWNAEAFALVSPKINQFVSDDTQLAAQDSQVDNSNTNVPPSHDSQSGFRQASYVVPSGRGDEQFSTPSSYKPEPVKKFQYNHSSAVSETTLAPPAPAQNTIKNDNKGMTKLAALSLPNNHYSKIQAVR